MKLRHWLVLLIVPFLMAQDYNVAFRPRAAASGSTYSWWVAGESTQIPGTAGTTYINPYAREDIGWSATQGAGTMAVAAAGTLDNFRCDVDNSLGAGTDKMTMTLQLSTAATSAPTDTAISCTITGGAGQNCTDADSVSVGAGDILVIKVVTEDTPSAPLNPMTCRMKFTPTTANQTILGFHVDEMSATQTRYWSPVGSHGFQTTEANAAMPIPTAGSITGIACASGTDLTGTMSHTLNVYVNGSSGSLNCVLDDTNQECLDTTGAMSVTANQTVSVQSVPLNSATANIQVGCSLIFEPTTSGEWVFMTHDWTGPSTTAEVWADVPAQILGWQGTFENIVNTRYPNVVVKNIYAKVTTAPGGSVTRTFSLRKNATNSTNITCGITGAATSCSDSGTETIAANDEVDLDASVSGGTAAASGIINIGITLGPP